MVGSEWKPRYPLNGHIYAFGRTDGGKTWKLTAVVQYYHSRKYKIFDLWGGKRKEGGSWCFPSDERRLWFEYEREVGEMESKGPKQYNVRLLYPLFKEETSHRLPEEKPNISAVPFTLYFKEIDIEEISTITGALSEQSKKAWTKLKKDLPDKSNGQDIIQWFDRKENNKYRGTALYKYFIEPFYEANILMGKNFPYNLDIVNECGSKVVKDEGDLREVISVLMDDYTPKQYKMFFILHFLRRIYDLGESDVIHRDNIAFLRELSYFMKVQDKSALDAEQKNIMRENFSEILRYGRSVILIAGDTQSPSEVRGLVEGQQDLLLLNELPGVKDRETACDGLIRDGLMSPQQRDFLGSTRMTKEKMVVVERGKIAKLIKRVQPPRTRCFKKTDGNFIKVWTKLKNSWRVDIKEIKQKISDAYYLSKAEEYYEKQSEKEGEIVEKTSLDVEKEKRGENKRDIRNDEDGKEEDEKLNKLKYNELKAKKIKEELEDPIVI